MDHREAHAKFVHMIDLHEDLSDQTLREMIEENRKACQHWGEEYDKAPDNPTVKSWYNYHYFRQGFFLVLADQRGILLGGI